MALRARPMLMEGWVLSTRFRVPGRVLSVQVIEDDVRHLLRAAAGLAGAKVREHDYREPIVRETHHVAGEAGVPALVPENAPPAVLTPDQPECVVRLGVLEAHGREQQSGQRRTAERVGLERVVPPRKVLEAGEHTAPAIVRRDAELLPEASLFVPVVTEHAAQDHPRDIVVDVRARVQCSTRTGAVEEYARSSGTTSSAASKISSSRRFRVGVRARAPTPTRRGVMAPVRRPWMVAGCGKRPAHFARARLVRTPLFASTRSAVTIRFQRHELGSCCNRRADPARDSKRRPTGLRSPFAAFLPHRAALTSWCSRRNMTRLCARIRNRSRNGSPRWGQRR
jgi:hypothetical protein